MGMKNISHRDHRETQRTTHYTTRLASHNVSHNRTRHISVNSSQRSGHHDAAWEGNYSGERSTEKNGYNGAIVGGGCSGNYTDYYWAVQAGKVTNSSPGGFIPPQTPCLGYSGPPVPPKSQTNEQYDN